MFFKILLIRWTRRAAILRRALCLALGTAVLLCAPASGKDDGDFKVLGTYHLTLEKLDAFDAINKKIAAAMATDPQLKKEMTGGVLNVGSTLDDALGPFESRAPHLAALLKSAGMSNRDYVLSIYSVMFASTGQMLKQTAPDQPLPDYIPADNVALAEKNAARFRDVMRNMDSLTARAKKSQSTDEATDE